MTLIKEKMLVKTADSTNPQYIPLREFYKKLAAYPNPYQCKFSLSPFFEKIDLATAQSSNKLILKAKHLLQEIEKEIGPIDVENTWKKHPEKIIPFTQLLFPQLFLQEKMGFLTLPFTESFLYLTPEFKEMMDKEDWEIKIPDSWNQTSNPRLINRGLIHWILYFFYGIEIPLATNEVLSFKNKKTGLYKFYKVKLIQDFIKAKSLKPLKKISDELLFELLNDFENTSLWQKYLPPENFAFEGFSIGLLIEITAEKVLEGIKEKMFNDDYETDHYEHLNQIEKLTGSFLNMPDLRLGVLRTSWSFWQEGTSWALLRKFDKEVVFPSFKDEKGSYGRVIKNKELVIISDLTKQKHLCKIEEELVEMGCKSLLLVPFFDKKQTLIGVVEMASPNSYAFNRLIYLQAFPLIELLGEGTNKFLTDLENLERQTMQNEFTSIHPSVEWRFREVAAKLFWQQTIEQQKVAIEPIVFKDLYPIYGQADIVGSSSLRNKSIQLDLQDNLAQALKLMQFCRKKVTFHLLDFYIQETQKRLQHLQAGQFISSDESQITELITQEIHPLLEELQVHFSKLLQKKIETYFKGIHSEINIVYQQRKAYDESVSQLNELIGQFLEKEDEKMQKILPHHFEKFTTDGVEYNIYLGDSLLKNGGYSPFFLKNFRLWQLIKMCEITRLVAANSGQFPLPLQTAQLVFVYNNTLSIHFKMEEKHFDVDGTYNVRYEILKKRVDKAIVKGTNERLTLAGKVAIVWLQEKDRREYWQYLTHLDKEGYIEGEVETLELEKLQGASGLRAFRFKVKL